MNRYDLKIEPSPRGQYVRREDALRFARKVAAMWAQIETRRVVAGLTKNAAGITLDDILNRIEREMSL